MGLFTTNIPSAVSPMDGPDRRFTNVFVWNKWVMWYKIKWYNTTYHMIYDMIYADLWLIDNDMIWHDMTYDMPYQAIRYDIWYDTIRHDMMWKQIWSLGNHLKPLTGSLWSLCSEHLCCLLTIPIPPGFETITRLILPSVLRKITIICHRLLCNNNWLHRIYLQRKVQRCLAQIHIVQHCICRMGLEWQAGWV